MADVSMLPDRPVHTSTTATAIWSGGASRYYNRNVFGFHPVQINDTHQLTLHLAAGAAINGLPDHSGQVFLDSSYQQVGRVDKLAGGDPVDFHAFNVLPDGERALVMYNAWATGKATYPGGDGKERPILNAGFEEMDLKTGKAVYSWNAYEAGLELDESYDLKNRDGVWDGYWDYIHMNAVDKDSVGDYYVSARHTHTIYKVSWLDKRIIWRLGGQKSSFSMSDDFRFHWQHDVRVYSVNTTHTILSIFDNASEDQGRNPEIPELPSSAKVILLDTVNIAATLLRNYTRPDFGHSRKLGNIQAIGGDGDIMASTLFVNWAQQGYITEYDAFGRRVLEAKFVSERMSSYRAYKFPWIGKPTEKPRCTILPTTISASLETQETASAFYVSWNGATEVDSWAFYGGDKNETESFQRVGGVKKAGFETSWMMPGVVKYGFAQALDRHGNVLADGRSEVVSILPERDGVYESLSAVPYGLDLDAAVIKGGLLSEVAAQRTCDSVSTAESKKTGIVRPTVWVNLARGFVYAFALFGFYSLALTLRPLAASRWRKGYRPLLPVSPTSDEEHLLDATGRYNSTFHDLVDRRIA